MILIASIIHRLPKSCFALYEFQLMKSEASSIFLAERAPLKVTILVFSGSSIMCVASAIDPLRAANRICGETMFDWQTVSLDGGAAVTTSGLPVAVSGAFDASRQEPTCWSSSAASARATKAHRR